MDQLLTTDEASKMLKIPKRTLYEWRYDKKSPGPKGFHVGKHIRYRASEIESFIERQIAAERAA